MAPKLPTKVSFWMGFALSFLTAIISGLELSFNVYALPLKKTFNFSQTQIEVIASMSSAGLAFGLLEPLCTWFFGFKTSCFITCIGMPVSSALLALFAYYNQVFHSWPSLIGVAQLILSTLNNIGFFASSGICVKIVSQKHTGKLVCCYLSAFCFGKIYYGTLFELFFGDDLPGFFITFTVSTIIISACFALLYPFSQNEELKLEAGFTPEENTDNEFQTETMSIGEMLRARFFLMSILASVVFYGCVLTCLNNITTIAQSVDMTDPLYTVFVMSVVIVFTRILFGVLFDTFRSQWCGFAFLMFCYLTFCVSMIICMFFLTASSMCLATVLIGVGVAAPPSTLSILLRHYGRSHYTVVISFLYTGAAICQIFLQVLLGLLYDSAVVHLELQDRVCYGRMCFYWIFLIMLTIAVVACVIQTLNFILSRRGERKCEELRRLLGEPNRRESTPTRKNEAP